MFACFRVLVVWFVCCWFDCFVVWVLLFCLCGLLLADLIALVGIADCGVVGLVLLRLVSCLGFV